MRKLYLDIDGVLLTKRNTRAADGAIELIDYALSNFDCYWLNTHCRNNDTKEVLRYLAEYFPNDVVNRLNVVKPAVWDTLKTEGIDFNSKFYWLDDCLFESEKKILDYYHCQGNMIKVNLDFQDELAWVIQVLKDKESEYERFLFLDIDGVLNTGNYGRSLIESGFDDRDSDGSLFDPIAVENLRYIIDTTKAMIVFSTSWRLDGSKYMCDLWERRNMPGKIAGITPSVEGIYFSEVDTEERYSRHAYGIRGMEIHEWLRRNTNERIKPYNYAILDDENDFLLFQSEHVVLTNPDMGITREIADKVIKILR